MIESYDWWHQGQCDPKTQAFCKNILSSFGEGDSNVLRGATRQLVSHSRGPKSAVKSSRWWSRTIRSGLLAALNAP